MNAARQPPSAVAPRLPAFATHSENPLRANILLLYESFDTAIRGKAFCDLLLTELDVCCDFDDSLWRSDLLSVPAIRHEVARAALKADFVVLSLRGDTELADAIECWCAEWMPRARNRNIALIAVFDPATARRFAMENVRTHLRKAAAAAGMRFFAHAVMPAGQGAALKPEHSAENAPLPGAVSRSAAEAQTQPWLAHTRKVGILVVDDYPVLCDVISRHLHEAGYETLQAHDGEEAQSVITANASEINLVISDIEMPRMRGDDLAAWLRREHREMRVLLMSSARPRSPSAQGLAYLEKPFRMEALVTAVREVLERPAHV